MLMLLLLLLLLLLLMMCDIVDVAVHAGQLLHRHRHHAAVRGLRAVRGAPALLRGHPADGDPDLAAGRHEGRLRERLHRLLHRNHHKIPAVFVGDAWLLLLLLLLLLLVLLLLLLLPHPLLRLLRRRLLLLQLLLVLLWLRVLLILQLLLLMLLLKLQLTLLLEKFLMPLMEVLLPKLEVPLILGIGVEAVIRINQRRNVFTLTGLSPSALPASLLFAPRIVKGTASRGEDAGQPCADLAAAADNARVDALPLRAQRGDADRGLPHSQGQREGHCCEAVPALARLPHVVIQGGGLADELRDRCHPIHE